MKMSYQKVIVLVAGLLFVFNAPVLSSQQTGIQNLNNPDAETIQVSSQPFYVYENGEFKEALLSKEPELIGGKELMETLIKLNIRYPDKAKAQKIGGTVLISVVIDSLGQMEDVFVHEGVGGGCNDEALRAVKLMNKVGFEPGELNGKPVTVKFDIPITFLPQ
jgi:periplasmic protein TonB